MFATLVTILTTPWNSRQKHILQFRIWSALKNRDLSFIKYFYKNHVLSLEFTMLCFFLIIMDSIIRLPSYSNTFKIVGLMISFLTYTSTSSSSLLLHFSWSRDSLVVVRVVTLGIVKWKWYVKWLCRTVVSVFPWIIIYDHNFQIWCVNHWYVFLSELTEICYDTLGTYLWD